MFCKFCDKEYTNSRGLKNHQVRCKENPDRKLQQLTEEGRKKLSDSAKKQMTDFYKDEANRELWSIKMLKAVKDNPDSYSKNNVSGRVKMYDINGTKVKGTWELEVAKYLNENDIEWTNDIEGIEYFWDNKIRLYFPDFYLPKENLYIEVKGYERERDHAKWEVVDNLIIIKDKEIKEIKNKEFKLGR